MLNETQLLAIEKLVEGKHTRTKIAEDLNISRQTLYNYLDNPLFITAMDERASQARGLIESELNGKMSFALENILKIATDSSNQRTMLDANKYLLDRSLGKPTTKVGLDAEVKAIAVAGVDVLEDEFAEFDKLD